MPESSGRPRRIVVGVSGASGAALGLECLKCLRQAGAESALVVTRGGEITIEQELGMTLDEYATHADVSTTTRISAPPSQAAPIRSMA